MHDLQQFKKPDMIYAHEMGCLNFKPQSPVLPPSKMKQVENIFHILPEYQEEITDDMTSSNARMTIFANR